MAKRRKKFKARVRPFGDYHPFTESEFLNDMDKVEKDWSRKRYGITFMLIGILLLWVVSVGNYGEGFYLPVNIGAKPYTGGEIPEGYTRFDKRIYTKFHFEFASQEDSYIESTLVRKYSLGASKYIPSALLFAIGIAHFLPKRKDK